MLTETAANQKVDVEDPIVEVIERYKMSSISMIASHLEMEEETVLIKIEELISAGTLVGKLSEDGTRFFKSNVKVSEAPVIPSTYQAVEIEEPDTKVGKYSMIAGIASIVSGLVLRSITGLSLAMTNMSTSLTLFGFVILAAGWLYISRKQVSIT
ncbi:MAG: hypothetical protein KAR33_09030 [Candidatus Thorarchaeota archaeon]|nr:hypothetical protein [Candidatus Thorarchaeota archaeon]